MPATLSAPAPLASQPSDLYAVTPRPDDPFPDSEFVNKPNVPVFAEHETLAKDGRKLKFGYAELKAVADRCNRRIQETGDYAALSLGHNPEPQAKAMGAATPKTVGYAGPFRMGEIKGFDGSTKFAILADLHYFSSDWEEAKKYGRRSAELWVEDRYEEMFLDPIALLGAETPRLDLGLVYSRYHEGRLIEKYAAVFPGAINTHVLDQQNYAAEAPMDNPGSQDPELVKAIVDAIMQLPQWQWIESQMAAMDSEGQTTAGSVGDAMGGQVPPANGPPGVPTPTAIPPSPPAGLQQPPPAAPAMPEPPQANGGPGLDAPGGEPGLDAPGGEPPQEPEKEKDMAYQKACYAALDAMDDTELQQYMAGRKAKRYQAEGSVDADDEPEADSGTYEQSPGQAKGISAEGEKTISEQGAEKPTQSNYARTNERTLKYQLDKVSTRLAKIEGELEAEHKRAIDAERRSRLQHYHHEGFLPDPDDAMERLCYAKCPDDKQFDSMLELLLAASPKIPIGRTLPYVPGAEKYERHRPGFKEESSEKYSKEDQQTAMAAVRRRINTSKDKLPDTTGWLDEELENARRSRNGSAA